MKRNLELEALGDAVNDSASDQQPHTTAEFLDALKTKMGIESDYRLARELNVSHTRISNWRRGRNTFDDGMAVTVAKLLGEDPAYVLTCCAAERTTRRDVKLAWKDAARRLAPATAAGIILALIGTFCPGVDGETMLIAWTFGAAPIEAFYTLSALALLAAGMWLCAVRQRPTRTVGMA